MNCDRVKKAPTATSLTNGLEKNAFLHDLTGDASFHPILNIVIEYWYMPLIKIYSMATVRSHSVQFSS
jgi:hypothetical protein